MKRFLSLLIIICFLPALGSCSSIYSNYREIQQLMVVQTMGIDQAQGSVQVSMAAAADAAGDGPRRMTARGSTITDAIDRAYRLSYEEEIFLSHVNHLLVGEAAAEEIQAGDRVDVDFDTGVITDRTTGKTYQAEPFPEFIQNIIRRGGLLASLKEV